MSEPTQAELLAQLAAMQEQMAKLQQQLTAQQSGSGGLAQAGGVAAGAGGVAVGGNLMGDIYLGTPTDDPTAALAIYRTVFVAGCRQLPLRSIDVDASDPLGGRKQLDLDQVYVALDTTLTALTVAGTKKERDDRIFLEREKPRALSLLEATVQNRRLVILGAPGCGKSTFVNHLGLCLALHGLEPAGGWLARLPQWPATEADLVPITVIMRDFARSVGQTTEQAAPHHLWRFIVQRLQAQNLDFVVQPLHDQVQAGNAIVLLDGIDEIPTRQQRTFVRDVVAAFATRYPVSRLVVTCRTLSYQDPAWQLAELPNVTVADLDEEKIHHFIAAWYAELDRLGVVKGEDAGRLTARLQEAVQRPDLRRLAPNPLLLTVMALVHSHKGRLPDARALLYEETIDLLLLRWEERKAGGQATNIGVRQRLTDVGRSEVDLKRVLWQLAFQAHGQARSETDETLADIGELQLEKALADLHPAKSRDWAGALIETIKLRAGLLLERAPESYTFPHRTFQEYLAGAHLAGQANFAQQAARLVQEGAFWWQVILLGVGRLVYLSGDLDKPLALVGELCPQRMPRTKTAWRQAWLAGEVLEEIGLNRVQDSTLGQDLLVRTRRRLTALVENNALTAVERAAAGRSLGRLGDPRSGVGVKGGLPDMEWVTVAAGPFLMGSDKEKDNLADDDEMPQFTCDLLRHPYQISRYPITVAQYQTFVAAGGYDQYQYWTEEGWQWRAGAEIRGPENYGSIYETPNHPQVGISWYEAVAFCRWLAAQTGKPIRLPSEAEWERAARHTDGRLYPWGNSGKPEQHCNMIDTGIGSTSTVGCFPTGNAVCGAADMAGNGWEWCSTQWRHDYQDYAERVDNALMGDTRRVLRGGSFVYNQISARCASRDHDFPVSRRYNIGFRVVSSPGL